MEIRSIQDCLILIRPKLPQRTTQILRLSQKILPDGLYSVIHAKFGNMGAALESWMKIRALRNISVSNVARTCTKLPLPPMGQYALSCLWALLIVRF